LRRVVLARTCRLKKRWDELLDKIIDDHATKSPWLVGGVHHQHDEQDQDRDLVDILLSLQHEYNLTRDNVKVILMV
uniref:Uncharacterized protein n=1 Tax=Aegilops tauschii subsp. strangulata TaxID=200361 RepID=A0A453M8P1_AEGTS